MQKEPVPVPLITAIPLFEDLSAPHQELIASISHIRHIGNGKELFHEGDSQDYLYIVLEGRIALELHIPNRGRLRFLTVENKEVVGWSSMADVMPHRTATATAVLDSKLLAIDAKQLHSACLNDCGLGFIIMHHVANVIATRLQATRMQLLDMFAQSAPEGNNG